ncbi:D-ribose pyranase [Endozoicomonas sp. ISHI1]
MQRTVATMKKTRLLNSQLSGAIASLGHGQGLTVCDCGLPIGDSVERIDLALTHGVPGFLDTLDVVFSETVVEEIIIAKEFAQVSPELYQQFAERIRRLGEEQGAPVKVVQATHESFKAQSDLSKAVVRTGECTPYANVILKSGVAF